MCRGRRASVLVLTWAATWDDGLLDPLSCLEGGGGNVL